VTPAPPFRPRVALASLSGESDAAWARAASEFVGAAFLGGIAIDGATRAAARELVDRDRTEFLPADPIAFVDAQLEALSDAALRPGFNVRTTSVGPLREAAAVCRDHGAILEINAHCRQAEMCAAGCGETLLRETDRLREYVAAAAGTGATVSVKLRAEVPGVDLPALSAALGSAGADLVHVDAMDSEPVVGEVAAATDAVVVANNGVRGGPTVRRDRPLAGPPGDRGVVRPRPGHRTGGTAVRTAPENAELALLLEVASTPTPGNVDRAREYPDLGFEQFLAGAVGARAGLAAVADGAPVGESFRRAVAGMSEQSAGNTQFGGLLLLTPLVRAVADDDLSPAGVEAVLGATTVADAAAFYRAFEHVDVAVDDPPAGMGDLDVRRGEAAVPAVRERGLTLGAVLARSAPVDGIAADLDAGCPRTFRIADHIADGDGRVVDRAARAHVAALAAEVDTFVVTQHDRETAEEVRRRAAAVRDGEGGPEALADDLVDRGINPGTTADLLAGGLFVALQRGLAV
jgi:triphosphoribosyl-dephospho-CoA synthase